MNVRLSNCTEIHMHPTVCFDSPWDLLANTELTRADKLHMLCSWEAEERLRRRTSPRHHDATRLSHILDCQARLVLA